MIKIDDKGAFRKKSISVEFFYRKIGERFKLKDLSGKTGFKKLITDQNLHRPGLALAGFLDLFVHNRVQVLGNTEMHYLNQFSAEEVLEKMRKLFSFDIPCIIFTDNNRPSSDMIGLARQYGVSVFSTVLTTTKAVFLITDFLDDQFAPRLTLHGSFIDVYGVGIMFMGKSGIGKSEVTLDLVERGQRLVADDVVILTKKGEGILMGCGTKLVGHFMEVRGIGLIDIRSMFGVRAIRFQKRLEVIIELELWDPNETYTRTGLDESTITILETEVPYIKLPIIPGKNITVIAEVIALNYLLKSYGYDSAKVLQKKLESQISANESSDSRVVDYFEHDFE